MDCDFIHENKNMWIGLFESKPTEIINLNFLPYILDTMSINKILKLLFGDLKKASQSKDILSRLKLLEILIDKQNIREKTICCIVKNKYYRDIYNIFKNNCDPIIKMTVGIHIIKKLGLYSDNIKIKKYYNLAQKLNKKERYILLEF